MLVLCVVLIFSTLVQTAMASNSLANEDYFQEEGSGSGAKYAYANSVITNLSISSAGKATCLASLTGYPGTTTKVEINMYLQQLKNGSWVNVNSWSKTFNSYSGTLEKTATVAKGYSYRVKASYYAYSGTKKENIVSYSGTKKY